MKVGLWQRGAGMSTQTHGGYYFFKCLRRRQTHSQNPLLTHAKHEEMPFEGGFASHGRRVTNSLPSTGHDGVFLK